MVHHHEKKQTADVTLTDWIMTAGSVASIAGFIAIAPNHPILTALAVCSFAALIWTKMNK